jgi:hypothetical protein
MFWHPCETVLIALERLPGAWAARSQLANSGILLSLARNILYYTRRFEPTL